MFITHCYYDYNDLLKRKKITNKTKQKQTKTILSLDFEAPVYREIFIKIVIVHHSKVQVVVVVVVA